MKKEKSPSKRLVIAHRGEHELAPENTIRACQLAIDQGATAVEVDVRLCGSGDLVLFHDNLLHRHFGKWKHVAFTSFDEMKSYTFAKNHYQHADRVYKLSEFIEEFKNKLPINLDIKTSYSNLPILAKKIIREVKKQNISDQVWISSFNPVFLKIFKAMESGLRTGYLFRNLLTMHTMFDIFLKSDAWHPHYKVLTEHFFDLAKKWNKEVYIWTVNNERVLDKLESYSFEGIITDKLFRNDLSSRGF